MTLLSVPQMLHRAPSSSAFTGSSSSALQSTQPYHPLPSTAKDRRLRSVNRSSGPVLNLQANVNSQDISANHPLQQNVASPLANESHLSFVSEVDVRSGGQGVNSPSQQLTTECKII